MAAQAGADAQATRLLTATLPQSWIYPTKACASRLPDRHENPARALWADWTLNHLASIRRLELHAFFTPLVAIRVILIGNRLLRDLRRRGGRVWQSAADRHATGRKYRVLQKRAPAKRRRPGTHVTPQLSASGGSTLLAIRLVARRFIPRTLDRGRQAMNVGNKSDVRRS